jgi:amino acid transporter
MIRGIGLRGAVAINAITMIGIGPLITIPLVLATLHGPLALVAWVVGALVALCDGLAWAELGSLFPGSGGTYAFLREAFGRGRAGRFLGFLFAWQTLLSAPLLLASGYIGFAHYAGYLWPPLASDARLQGVVAAGVGVLTLAVLYRRIATVGAIGVALAGVAVATLGAVIAAGATHFSAPTAFALDPHSNGATALAAGLGPALIITLYDYAGYGTACTIGDEIVAPARTLPRAVVVSIALVAVLYIALQVGILGVVPWHDLIAATPGGAIPDAANYVASTVVERVWGAWPARIVTLAILATAFASTFGVLLGASRVPYAAAVDGVFLRPFAALDARGGFPNVALLAIGLLALPACFFSLGDVINALTTGLVVIGSIAQLVAVAVLRARGVRAPYRMWLYPLPALVALAGWAYVFVSAGTPAIAFGIGSLAAGSLVYALRSRFARARTTTTLGLALAFLAATFAGAGARAASAADFGHAALVERDGRTLFRFDGKPFFVYGAAFFYERLPREEWQRSLLALRDELGINTLDLYVPWNWHELADGDFDFTGRTNPRRDLAGLLRLAAQDGFAIILRPGPVIRNEWRNGGYPAWLLERPAYGMPLRDVLEGRYPATATLQNAHSDDAAAEWMRNTTHRFYARRWLERVLAACAPAADRVLAVALDDDQGAYIDNQTWPAPHLRAYLDWLRGVVQGVTGPQEPVFINTYQMKVPASSPVWTMGNWYQSDAYAIGDHDRSQLEFSTGLLETRPHQPLMLSEFQAGWLQQPQDVLPQPADPSNTLLALHTMLAMGVRGVVNFPAQDTLNPAGWEAPFANAFYAWDAALGYEPDVRSPRFAPTARVGALVRAFGPMLANATVRSDAAIAYLTSSYDTASLDNSDVAAIAGATLDAQRACRNAGAACDVVDPRFEPDALARYPVVVVPHAPRLGARPLLPEVRAALAAYERRGGIVANGVPASAELDALLARVGRTRTVRGADAATYAEDPASGAGFVTLANYATTPQRYERLVVRRADGTEVVLPPFALAARDAALLPIDVPLRAYDRRFASNDVLADATCDVAALRLSAEGLLVTPDLGGASACTLRVRVAGRTLATTFAAAAPASLLVTPAGDIRPTTLVDHVGALGPGAIGRETPRTLPLRNDTLVEEPPHPTAAPGTAIAYVADVYRDGAPCVVLENALVRIVVSPRAGARAFVFEDVRTHRDVFDTVGALRDDVVTPPPSSPTDRIAAYTHQFPAGFFNRPYTATIAASVTRAVVRLAYDAPDAFPHGGHFERTLTLLPDSRAFDVDARATFDGSDAAASSQRGAIVSSLAAGDPRRPTLRAFADAEHDPNAPYAALYDARTHDLVVEAWDGRDPAETRPQMLSLVTVVRADDAGRMHLRFLNATAATEADARAAAARFAATQGALALPRTSPHAGKWRNGLRDRLKSG